MYNTYCTAVCVERGCIINISKPADFSLLVSLGSYECEHAHCYTVKCAGSCVVRFPEVLRISGVFSDPL